MTEPRKVVPSDGSPTTEAGRRLVERLGWFASEKGDALLDGILAIEAEAAGGPRDEQGLIQAFRQHRQQGCACKHPSAAALADTGAER